MATNILTYSQDSDNKIKFLVKRIVAFARLAEGAISPAYKSFWLGQIISYQSELKKVTK